MLSGVGLAAVIANWEKIVDKVIKWLKAAQKFFVNLYNKAKNFFTSVNSQSAKGYAKLKKVGGSIQLTCYDPEKIRSLYPEVESSVKKASSVVINLSNDSSIEIRRLGEQFEHLKEIGNGNFEVEAKFDELKYHPDAYAVGNIGNYEKYIKDKLVKLDKQVMDPIDVTTIKGYLDDCKAISNFLNKTETEVTNVSHNVIKSLKNMDAVLKSKSKDMTDENANKTTRTFMSSLKQVVSKSMDYMMRAIKYIRYIQEQYCDAVAKNTTCFCRLLTAYADIADREVVQGMIISASSDKRFNPNDSSVKDL